MSRTETITCDICGRVKQMVNHWFVILVERDFIGVGSADRIPPMSEGWTQRFDLCGRECLHRKLNELLEGER